MAAHLVDYFPHLHPLTARASVPKQPRVGMTVGRDGADALTGLIEI